MPSPPGNTEVLIQNPKGAILARPEFAEAVHDDWFQPDWWGAAAKPVANGGRGTAWFVRHDTDDWVLRHYSRGGMVARISQLTYGYTGADRVRSFAEFRLLNDLLALDLPVPFPVAAWFERSAGITYRAGILVRTIPEARPFADYLHDDDSPLWRQVGALVRRFHDRGVDHADLNCHNVLVTEASLYLIDFDKGAIRQPGSGDWAERNLRRLRRSAEKIRQAKVPEASWQSLLEGYDEGSGLVDSDRE